MLAPRSTYKIIPWGKSINVLFRVIPGSVKCKCLGSERLLSQNEKMCMSVTVQHSAPGKFGLIFTNGTTSG